MMVRFKTDATAIHVHYKLMDSDLDMPHMPATGVSGVDLYARDTLGKWKWVQVTKPASQEVKAEIIRGLALGYREYAAYLPLYNGVDFMSIGVEEGSKFEGALRDAKSRSSSTERALHTVHVQAVQAWCIRRYWVGGSTCRS